MKCNAVILLVYMYLFLLNAKQTSRHRQLSHSLNTVTNIIIWCKCFFLFIGRKPTTWAANNCLQTMVCSCKMLFNCFWPQILFCSCINETTLFSFLRLHLRENGRSLCFPKIFLKNKLGDQMINQLLNSVIAKYCDLSVSRRSFICLSLWLRQNIVITDLLATDKSRYFAQPCPINAKYPTHTNSPHFSIHFL